MPSAKADQHHAVALLTDEDYEAGQQYLKGGWEALSPQARERARQLFHARYGRPMASER